MNVVVVGNNAPILIEIVNKRSELGTIASGLQSCAFLKLALFNTRT